MSHELFIARVATSDQPPRLWPAPLLAALEAIYGTHSHTILGSDSWGPAIHGGPTQEVIASRCSTSPYTRGYHPQSRTVGLAASAWQLAGLSPSEIKPPPVSFHINTPDRGLEAQFTTSQAELQHLKGLFFHGIISARGGGFHSLQVSLGPWHIQQQWVHSEGTKIPKDLFLLENISLNLRLFKCKQATRRLKKHPGYTIHLAAVSSLIPRPSEFTTVFLIPRLQLEAE